MEEVKSRVSQFLRSEVIRSENSFDDDTELFSEGLLDSMNLVQLMLFVEESFSVRIDPFDLSYEHFGSVTRIANYIIQKRP